MTCASSAANITRGLGKNEGVIKADVNFATEKAVIEFDETKTNLDELNKIIIVI